MLIYLYKTDERLKQFRYNFDADSLNELSFFACLIDPKLRYTESVPKSKQFS